MSRAHAGIPAYARTRLKGLIDVRARYEAMHEGPLRVDSRMTLNPVLSVVIDSMHVDEVHIDVVVLRRALAVTRRIRASVSLSLKGRTQETEIYAR
jgi:hypothetical protein